MAAMRGRRQVDEELEGLALDEEAEYQRFLQVREGGEGCEWGASHRMPQRRARGQAEAALLPVSGKLSRHNMSLAGRRGLAVRRVPARLPVPQSLRGGEGGEDAPLGFLEDDGEDSGGAALAWLGRFWAGGAAASFGPFAPACRWLSGQLCTAAMHPSACRCRYLLQMTAISSRSCGACWAWLRRRRRGRAAAGGPGGEGRPQRWVRLAPPTPPRPLGGKGGYACLPAYRLTRHTCLSSPCTPCRLPAHPPACLQRQPRQRGPRQARWTRSALGERTIESVAALREHRLRPLAPKREYEARLAAGTGCQSLRSSLALDAAGAQLRVCCVTRCVPLPPPPRSVHH